MNYQSQEYKKHLDNDQGYLMYVCKPYCTFLIFILRSLRTGSLGMADIVGD